MTPEFETRWLMPVDIKVPPMGESIADANVARWLKQVGDAVRAGEDEPVVGVQLQQCVHDVIVA